MLIAVPDSVDVPALIRSRLPELSPNDRRIAAWLLEHEAEAPFQTAESLARGAGVSKAAVVRFGSRLGFGGYAGLSEAMAGAATQRLARQGGAGRTTSQGSLLDRWLSACLGDLEVTRNAISDVLLDTVATLLLAGDGRTYVFGQRKSASLAEYAFFLLSPLVPNVQLIASGTASLADLLLDVHAGDRLLVFTFRPYARLAGEVIEFFRQAGGSIVLVTDDALGPSARLADHVLVCAPDSPGPFASAVGGMFVVEAVAAAVAERVSDEGRQAAARALWGRFGTY
jgi:DNA-binding MurR/RpiR family transcriptional regulator